MSESESIHLAADISFLHTDYLWRMPGSWIGYPYYGTSEFYEELARVAERGIMDMLFFGDTGGTSEDYGGNHDAVVRYGAKWPRHDMTPMIPLMAKAAPGVGFALTMSTTYHHPFHCARLFNALDHVTRGRIAWNAKEVKVVAHWDLAVLFDDQADDVLVDAKNLRASMIANEARLFAIRNAVKEVVMDESHALIS